MLLRETGARARRLPVWETLCCGALVLAATGSDEQQQALLPGIVGGDLLLTPALREVGRALDEAPATTYADGRLTGRKIAVTYADRAARLLVTADAAATSRSSPWSTPRPRGHAARVGLQRARHHRTPSSSTARGPSCSARARPRCWPSATSPVCA